MSQGSRRLWQLLIMVVALVTGCTPAAQPPPATAGVIAIAADFPLQGVWRSAGVSIMDGAQFAVERRGHIGRYRLVFKPFDDTLAGLPDYQKAIQNIKLMGADSQILGMVGPFNSFLAQLQIPAANPYDLAIVSPTTTDNCLTMAFAGCRPPTRVNGINNFFRIAAPDRDQATAMATMAVKTLHAVRIAVLSDGYPYGENLAASFAQALSAAGGTVVLRQRLDPSTNDFSELLQRIKDLGAQAIYLGGAPIFGDCRVRAQMEAKLPDAYFLGGDALITQSCIDDAQTGANQLMIATIAQGVPSSEPQATQVEAAIKRMDPQASAYTYAAYDSAEILMDAIQRAMDANGGRIPNRLQVIQALSNTHLKGVTGTWAFDEHGDATGPGISFYRVDGGTWKFWQGVTITKT